MKYEIINGCLINAFKNKEVEGIVHCANCHCTMGSGVARAIVDNFPDAYEADCKTVKGSISKLGTFSCSNNEYGTIFNMYAQYNFGPPPTLYLNYDAVREGLRSIKEYCDVHDIKSLGVPYKMGCDRAGGDWNIVSDMINGTFENSDISIKIFKLS